MPFSLAMQAALRQYHQEKGWFNRLIGRSHPAVQALTRLAEDERSNLFMIYRALKTNAMQWDTPAYNIYRVFLTELLGADYGYLQFSFDKLFTQQLITLNNFDSIVVWLKSIKNVIRIDTPEEIEVFRELDMLYFQLNNQRETYREALTLFVNSFLTQETLETLMNIRSTDIYPILLCLKEANLFTANNFNRLLHENNRYLYSEEGKRLIWDRITGYHLTQTVFDQLIIYAQQADRGQVIPGYIARVLDLADRALHLANQAPAGNINYAQSTHNTSVHLSVSESASKLKSRYQDTLSKKGVDYFIQEMSAFIHRLPEGPINDAAKRCIQAMPLLDFVDPASHVSMQELLALVWIAISDEALRIGTLADAQEKLIQGFYERQREYNLSTTDVDQGGRDRTSCTSGSFNKLIDILTTIHPDCVIRFITMETATLKLPVIVREETICHLSELARTQTGESILAATLRELIVRINIEGVEVIWPDIKEKIAHRVLDEFRVLFEDDEDPSSWDAFIENGLYCSLPQLDPFLFQKELQRSPGYQAILSQQLQYSGFFAAAVHRQSMNDLIDRRHDTPDAQEEYDKQFALVVRQ